MSTTSRPSPAEPDPTAAGTPAAEPVAGSSVPSWDADHGPRPEAGPGTELDAGPETGRVPEPDAATDDVIPEHGEQAEPRLGSPDSWRATLAAAGLPDTLLGVGDPGEHALDLTHAHPSGLATLLAGRPTPLSMLFREAALHSAARRRSRALRAAAGELSSDRGVQAGLLTAGVATWVGRREHGELVRGPVLLRGCSVRPRGAGHDDYELQLDDTAAVNPEVLRRLREDHAVRLDADALAALAFGIHGFDPAPVFSVLEAACVGVEGFVVDPRLLVGCFTAGSEALLADLEAALPALARHPLFARLDGPDIGSTSGAGQGGTDTAAARDVVERLPAVLDLDPEQAAVLDAVLAGEHVAVEGPPGTGLTHTLAACICGLVEQGRRVLVLAPYRGSADALRDRLDAAGLGDVVLDLHDGAGHRPRLLAGLGAALDAAVSDRPPEEPTALLEQPAGVSRPSSPSAEEAREMLDGGIAALHARREPWGVSAYEAMVALAALMASPSSPRTRVRLPPDVCRRLDGVTREALRADLREAAALGAFTLTAEQAPWLDARLGSEADAAHAVEAARSGRDGLHLARSSMARIAAAAGLVEAASVDGWHRQLDLLVGVRDTLDVLLPTVFEQPLADLIAATAPEGGPPGLGFMARRALRRRARALVRPGVHLPDLHERLLAAQRQLAGWQARSAGGGWPRVPTGLAV
ncbi:MAG TPA: AAA family ATPase, partial [Kineosporiaceae bacterium]|nr:AAA family ATPase [Kineosporiaceae bacterium]